jgi:hypothetical protein
MKPEDYIIGPRIDTPELLRDVLANEDAVYVNGEFTPCCDLQETKRYYSHIAMYVRTFHRAYLKCPQTAKEMRKETAP